MANLSDLIIQHPEVDNFDALKKLVIEMAKNGVKPDYRDTPRNWELKLEAAFYWGDKVSS